MSRKTDGYPCSRRRSSWASGVSRGSTISRHLFAWGHTWETSRNWARKGSSPCREEWAEKDSGILWKGMGSRFSRRRSKVSKASRRRALRVDTPQGTPAWGT